MSAPLSPDASFDATEGPHCHLRMVPVGISARAAGGGPSHFECPTCDHAADDPMMSGAAGWLNSDLKAPE